MRGLIKAAAGPSAASDWLGPAPEARGGAIEDPMVSELAAVRAQAAELAKGLAESQAEVARLKTERSAAYEQGQEAGQELGRRQADSRGEARLSALKGGIELALDQFRTDLTALERLAPLLAQTALAKILTLGEGRRALIAEAIRKQIGGLEAQTILSIEVAADDFPAGAEREALKGLVGGEVQVRALENMSSGDCRIRLRLGELEVGVGQQWMRLKAVLEQLASPEPGS